MKQLQQKVADDFRTGRLTLPGMPEVAWRIRDAVQGERRSIDQVARIVQLDPVLATRLVQIANSPRYAGSKSVDSCRMAIMRLGLDAVRNLATSLALRSAHRAGDGQLNRIMQSAWQQSSRVGAISQVLAGSTPGMSPDRALLAGLVHNIGILPAVTYLEANPELRQDSDAVRALLHWMRGRLGGMLLRHWRFDPAIAVVPEGVEDWLRDGGEVADYLDLVLVARVFALLGRRDEGDPALPSLPEMPAFRKLPISRFGPDAALQVLEEAEGEIQGVLKLLLS